VDGVYVGSHFAPILSFNNIQSIEIDKGPQGTLFGRNATGGVIQINTKDPSQYAFTSVEGRLRQLQHVGRQVLLEPLASPTRLQRTSLIRVRSEDGWGKNLYTGQDVYTAIIVRPAPSGYGRKRFDQSDARAGLQFTISVK